jgi:hypothetical protein
MKSLIADMIDELTILPFHTRGKLGRRGKLCGNTKLEELTGPFLDFPRYISTGRGGPWQG